jgi:hypothetical protein
MVDAGGTGSVGAWGKGGDGTGSREPGAGSREPGAGSGEPGAVSREPGAGSGGPSDGESGQCGVSGESGSVKCEGFVYIYIYIYMETVVRAVGLVQGENVRGLYFYTLGSVKCEGFV